MYIALLGPAWCLGHAVALLRRQAVATVLLLAVVLACHPGTAASAFEEAIRLVPDDPRPQVNLALLQRGELPGVRERCP